MSSPCTSTDEERPAPRRSRPARSTTNSSNSSQTSRTSYKPPMAGFTLTDRLTGNGRPECVQLNLLGHENQWDPTSRDSQAEFRKYYHDIPEDAELPHFNQQGAGYAPSFRHYQVKAQREEAEKKAKAWLRDPKNQAALKTLLEREDGGEEGEQKQEEDLRGEYDDTEDDKSG